MDLKKILLIINPAAGKTRTRVKAQDIIDRLPFTEYDVEVHETKGRGDATDLAAQYGEGKDLIICSGGDGTLNETINGIMKLESPRKVGYVASGSTNDLANTLGIPTDLSQSINLIKSGKSNSYDLGLFNNERYYTYIASFGAFTSASYATSQKLKNKIGHLAYIISIFKAWSSIKSTHVHIEYDGGVIDDDVMICAVANSTSAGGIIKLKKDEIKLNDGYLELLLVKKFKPSEAPAIFAKVTKQDYSDPRFVVTKTKHFKMTSEEDVPWTIDGEYGGAYKECCIDVAERPIRICSPENELFIKD